jgi:hypothetical protein
VKAQEGLVRFLLFLREEEERERLEEIERLKPVGTEVGSYVEYRCKAEVSQIVKLEDGDSISIDNRCWIRSGHTITKACLPADPLRILLLHTFPFLAELLRGLEI